jgi:hypothetical protein
MFLQNDTLFINFHIDTMVSTIGRKLMAGDVIELPHLRDDLLLDDRKDAINRFYVITDASRPSEGFDPNWWPHMWRCKLGPISDSQEYRDIIGYGDEEDDLRNIISTYKDEIDISDAIVQQAENNVPNDPYYAAGNHLFVDEDAKGKPFIGTIEGAPNGATLLGSGITFPLSAVDGDYFLRTDFNPSRIFKKSGNRWVKVADDSKRVFSSANRILDGFINNTTQTTNSDGTVADERTNLSKVVKPKTDN